MTIQWLLRNFIPECNIRIIEKMNICGTPKWEILKEGTVKELQEIEFDSDGWYRIKDWQATKKGFDITVEH